VGRGGGGFVAVAATCALSTVASAQEGPQPRSAAELRCYAYRDNSGLTVLTAATTLEHQVSPRYTAWGRVLVDHIDVKRDVLDPGDPAAAEQLTGHHDPDAVTSASSVAGGGGVAQKQRYEGTAALRIAVTAGELPVTGQVLVRTGVEPDYRSYSGQLSGGVELFERNTSITGVLGLGHDTVDPIERPPGPPERFPASHNRVSLGTTISQLLSTRVVALAGASAVFQRGTLSNPYRRALVQPHGATVGTLFPELLPSARDRYTAFLGASALIVEGTALHLQQGVYLDSWGVGAFIPEASLVHDFGLRQSRVPLVRLRYRYYTQTAASFHADHTHVVESRLSGDPRLGRTVDHTGGLDVSWPLVHPIQSLELSLQAGYELSVLDYRDDHTSAIRGHIVNVGLAGAF
jgi:hypothetical protein